MACRRAFDLDLVACLLDAERPEWVAFKEHYPLCPDCAAEVRTWTELQGSLASPHPSPEALVQLEDGGRGLAAEMRAQMAAHVAECPSCRDELRALRGFDPAALAAATAPAPPAPAPEPAPAPAAAAAAAPRRRRRPFVVRLLAHPAFAYAVALAVAIPALAPRLRPLLESKRPVPRAAPDAASEAAAEGSRQGPEERQRAKAAPAAPPPAAAPATTSALADRREAAPQDESGGAAPWPLVVLEPSRETVVRRPHRGGIVLRLAPPRSQPAVPAALVSLRLRDATGRREIAEQQLGAPGSAAELRVPAGWLEPGGYRAELVLGDDSRPAATAPLRIEP